MESYNVVLDDINLEERDSKFERTESLLRNSKLEKRSSLNPTTKLLWFLTFIFSFNFSYIDFNHHKSILFRSQVGENFLSDITANAYDRPQRTCNPKSIRNVIKSNGFRCKCFGRLWQVLQVIPHVNDCFPEDKGTGNNC